MRALLVIVVASASCSTPRASEHAPISGIRTRPLPAIGALGRNSTEANWKERLEQPYVYLKKRGDYRDLGLAMNQLLAEVREVGVRGVGAPFALFYDDPGKVPLTALQARVCFPVAELPARLGHLEFDLLPRAMVVYTRIPGTQLAVTHAYPALFAYLRELGWQPGGPVREVYQVSSGDAGPEELVTEVQIPWTARAELPAGYPAEEE